MNIKNIAFYLGAFIGSAVMSLNTGCVAGSFELTRDYANWVKEKKIGMRIVLYILTFFVFIITMLIDVVVNNTVEFWEGKVEEGVYNFEDAGKNYRVKHEYIGKERLKQSLIQTLREGKVLQEVILKETNSGQIEMYVDGVLRTKVDNINNLPTASIYNENGKLVKTEFILNDSTIASL